MLMGLCLMVYSLGLIEVRYQLYQAKTGIPNQLGKLTNRPTFRWIFQCASRHSFIGSSRGSPYKLVEVRPKYGCIN